MIRHVSGFAEIVEDVNAALAFYRDTLGLEVKSQDGDDYAIVEIPGVLHFGIWNRGHAAQSTFGSRDHADKIPLGFTVEIEVDSTEEAAAKIKGDGCEIAQEPTEEPWGQKTFRLISPGGSLLGFAETPWARKIIQEMKVEEAGEGS